jgi:hypothetical protein
MPQQGCLAGAGRPDSAFTINRSAQIGITGCIAPDFRSLGQGKGEKSPH